ncbi:hypothetical protein P7C70_g8549, partial [Phenoliferia sp. Uapishka_3]
MTDPTQPITRRDTKAGTTQGDDSSSTSSPTISIPSLPSEVLLHIVKFVPHFAYSRRPDRSVEALRNLSLSSRLLRDFAQPLLYENISVNHKAMPLLVASEAFPRYRITELELDWRRLSRRANQAQAEERRILQDVAILIKGAGERGLKTLSLLSEGGEFSASLLESAGPALKTLDLFHTNIEDKDPEPTWNFPFQLVNLNLTLENQTLSNSFLTSIISSSPSLKSLDVRSEPESFGLELLLSLPAFAPFATQITSLRFNISPRSHFLRPFLSHFTSVSHLSIAHQGDDMIDLHKFLECMPSKRRTLTHLSLDLTRWDFEHPIEAIGWKHIMHSEALKELKLISWNNIHRSEGIRMPCLKAERRPEVEMEYLGAWGSRRNGTLSKSKPPEDDAEVNIFQ